MGVGAEGIQMPSFIGRDEERELLRTVLAGASAGRLCSIFVEGEAGIGKSRLVEDLLSFASERNVEIVVARCEEYESARAFGALARGFGCHRSASEERRATIGAMLDEDADRIDAQHFRLVDRFVELIEAVAMERPLLLVAEDMHWADPATVAVLRAVLGRLRFEPLAIVATARPHPRTPALGAFVRAVTGSGGIQVTLDALSESDVERLLRVTLGAQPDNALLGFVAGAAGNPLFIGELLGALQEEGAIEETEGRAIMQVASLPPGLRPTILRRISYLSDDALGLLKAASILGSSFSPADVAAVLRTPLPALLPSLDECVRARVLEGQGTAIRFRHDLIREALYLDRPNAVRQGLHLEAARALRDAGAPLAQVAEQFALGARQGDREAINTIRAAALTVQRSPATRAELLRRALSLTAPDDPEKDALRADLAETLIPCGLVQEAEDVARELLDDPAFARRMRSVLVDALRVGARWVDLAGVTDVWLSEAELDEDERVELMATSAFARGSSSAFDAREAVATASDALARAERLGDDALIVAAAIAHIPGASRAAIPGLFPLNERAARIAEAQPDHRVLAHQPHYFLGRIYLSGHLGDITPDLDAAERAFRTGMRLSEDAGRAADVPVYLDGLAHLHFFAERWDESLAHAEAAVEAAEEIGARKLLTGTHAIIAHVSIHRGAFDVAEVHIRQEERLAEQLGPQFEEAFLAHRAMLHEAQGDLERALAYRWAAFERSASGPVTAQWWLPLWFAVEVGDASKGAAIVDWLRARSAEGEPAVSFHRFASALVAGDLDGVRRHVGRLETLLGAQAQHEIAAFAFARLGSAEEAVAHFRAAAEKWLRTGAYAWHDQRAAQMRRHGVIIPRRGRARPRAGWDSLTNAEKTVARLAAEGLTNPQIGERLFVSRRTVQSHLAHVFRKLGISSRVELAREVATRNRP